MNKKLNNKGKGAGLALIIILIVALLVAFLAVRQFSPLGMDSSGNSEAQQSPVEQAQSAVDAINDRLRQTAQVP